MKEEKIVEQLDRIEKLTLLGAKNFLTTDEAVIYLGICKASVYEMMKKHSIPYSKPNGKRCYFKKADLDKWMGTNRVASASELEEQAAMYCANH